MNGPTPTKADLRDRLIAAVVSETAEFGHVGVTVERIVRKAGATGASFSANFAGKEAAIEAAYEDSFERYLDRLLQTCKVQPSWPLKVKVGIAVTLDMAAASPVEARFLVETMTGAWGLAGGNVDSRDRLARLLVAGRTETPHGAELPGITESVLVAGIAGVISNQLQAGEARYLPGVAPQLVELTLTPYLGRERAAEVARRPRPHPLDR